MILIEVYVPAVDQAYEFEVDEHATIASVTEGLATLVASEKGRPWDERSQPMLCCQDTAVILSKKKSLYQCRVRPGSRLLLV